MSHRQSYIPTCKITVTFRRSWACQRNITKINWSSGMVLLTRLAQSSSSLTQTMCVEQLRRPMSLKAWQVPRIDIQAVRCRVERQTWSQIEHTNTITDLLINRVAMHEWQPGIWRRSYISINEDAWETDKDHWTLSATGSSSYIQHRLCPCIIDLASCINHVPYTCSLIDRRRVMYTVRLSSHTWSS